MNKNDLIVFKENALPIQGFFARNGDNQLYSSLNECSDKNNVNPSECVIEIKYPDGIGHTLVKDVLKVQHNTPFTMDDLEDNLRIENLTVFKPDGNGQLLIEIKNHSYDNVILNDVTEIEELGNYLLNIAKAIKNEI